MSGLDRRALALGLAAGLLAACTPDGTPIATGTGPLTFALDPVAGAPEAVGQSFAAALTAEATRRRLAAAEPGAAPAYRIRAYVSAASEAGQTRFDYVIDLARSADGHTGRVAGTETAPAAADPWSAIDAGVIARAAAKAADGIAGWIAAA